MTIKERKANHIDICLKKDVNPGYNYWNDVKFIHEALPELDYDEIDTSCVVFGKKLDFPFMVTAITGGFDGAVKINKNIAEACAIAGVGMGVGSERAGIEDVCPESYSVIKDYDIPLVIGNIGVPQLVPQKKKKPYTIDDGKKAMELIDADFLALHLNFLQETAQPEGDKNSKGCSEAIRSFSKELPIIVKETGAGISKETIKRIEGFGVRGIDVAGMGGTSFAAVEMHRAINAKDTIRENIGNTFFDWGIPTPVSLYSIKTGMPLISSGGIRNGLDIARSIALGASMAGAANLLLSDAMTSVDAVVKRLQIIKEELKTAMMLTGSSTIDELSKKKVIIVGSTKEWIQGMK